MTKMPDDPDGYCYPAVGTLAAELHCSKRVIQRALRALERDEWFVRYDPLPERRTYRYKPNWKRAEHELQIFEAEKQRRKRARIVGLGRPEGDKSVTLDRQKRRPPMTLIPPTMPDPSSNHLLESSFCVSPLISLSERDTHIEQKRRAAASAPASNEASPRRDTQLSKEDRLWKPRLAHARQRRIWYEEWGPVPNQPGCSVPKHLVKEPDGEGWELANIDADRSWEEGQEIRSN
jgi:hypothetical protein